MSRVSVIIPTRDRAHLIRRVLDSVYSQTRLPDEVIVVDDGSKDDTCNIIKSHYPDVVLLSQENQGVSSARNKGIETAKFDWIALLDSDDAWQPEKIEYQMKSLENQSEFLFCHTNEIWIRNGIHVNPLKKHVKRGGDIFLHCLPLCVISPSSVIMHRTILDSVGLFDTNLPVCEDYDIWLRICSRFPVLYLNGKLVTKYGGHDDQLSRKYWGMDRFRIMALENIISETSLSAYERDEAVKMMLEKINIYLHGAYKHNNKKHVAHYERLLKFYSKPENKQTVSIR